MAVTMFAYVFLVCILLVTIPPSPCGGAPQLSIFTRVNGKFLIKKDAVTYFKVHIRENGRRYDELVDVNTGSGLEYFHVPAHSNVDEADFLHDFIKPSSTSEELTNEETEWNQVGILRNRKILSDDMARLCANYSIYILSESTKDHRNTQLLAQDQERRSICLSKVCFWARRCYIRCRPRCQRICQAIHICRYIIC